MTTETNVIDVHEDISEDIVDDSTDELVVSFKECIDKALLDDNRIKKINAIQEDQDIYLNMFAPLPGTVNGRRPLLMKSSLYKHIFSKYSAGAKKLPKMLPKKVAHADLDESIMGALEEDITDTSGFRETYRDTIFPQFKDIGCPIIQMGTDDEGITQDSPDLVDMYFDPDGNMLQSKSGKGKLCKWSIRRVRLARKDANEFLRKHDREDLVNKLTSGDPMNRQEEGDLREDEEVRRAQMTDPVTFYMCFSITDRKNPIFMIFGGSSNTIVKRREGKAYPYWKKFRKKYRPILPHNIFHFSDDKYGLYSDSIIGIMKDGAEALKQVLNQFLPNVARGINPWNFLLGDTDTRTLEEMKAYNELQGMGTTPLIVSSNPNTRIESVAPNVQGVAEAFRIQKQEILDDLGTRLRVSFNAFSVDRERKATEFVGQENIENEQIASLNDNNKHVFEWRSEFSIDLAVKGKSIKGDEEVSFSISADGAELQEFSISNKQALMIAKEWDGSFIADPTLKTPLSGQDKRLAVKETIAGLTNLLGAIDYQTMEEVMPILRTQFKELQLNELDDDITFQDLVRMAKSVIDRRSQPLEADLASVNQGKQKTEEEQLEENIPKKFRPE